MDNVRTVSISELVGILEGDPRKGAKICTIVSRTTPKMLVKDRVTGEPNTFGVVTRVAHRSVCLGANYENAVNRQRMAEDNDTHFDAQALWNGAGERASALTVRHKKTGKLYFAFRPQQVGEAGMVKVLADAWFDGNGNPVAHSALVNFLPVQSKAYNQEVDRDVAWRTLELDNVLELHYGGTRYIVAA